MLTTRHSGQVIAADAAMLSAYRPISPPLLAHAPRLRIANSCGAPLRPPAALVILSGGDPAPRCDHERQQEPIAGVRRRRAPRYLSDRSIALRRWQPSAVKAALLLVAAAALVLLKMAVAVVVFAVYG